jgi:TolA-binding protein
LLTLYPERAENDAALYQLARAHWEAGRTAEAAARLTQLRTRHPRSAYAGEAAFRLGEHAVATHDFLQAVELFRTAQSGSDPALAESARYQLGWAYLNLQEYRRAADAFVAILDASARGPARGAQRPAAGPPSRSGPNRLFRSPNFQSPRRSSSPRSSKPSC